MMLTRLSKRLREENWVAVAIEFLILVLGVWLGLQAQQWSDSRNDRAHERQMISGMLADLRISREGFGRILVADKRRIGAANESLKGANLPPISFAALRNRPAWSRFADNGGDLPTLAQLSPDLLWTDVIMGDFSVGSTSAYDAMIGAGDSRLIGSRDLLRQIELYHNKYETVLGQNEKLLSVRQAGLLVGAKFGLAPFQSMPVERYFRLVAANPELAATVRTQATFTIFHYGDALTADHQAAALERRLRARLDDLE